MRQSLAVRFLGVVFLLSIGIFLWSCSSQEDMKDKCGAYVAPDVWKEFDCYNLAAIGKTTSDDPFTPSWRLIGGYWQWGHKGPNSSQWYDTNTRHYAHGPTSVRGRDANSGTIIGWSQTNAPDGSWSDTVKTSNDPCPDGFRVPTHTQWVGVLKNNSLNREGSWIGVDTNYGSVLFLGTDLMLPATGGRLYRSGALGGRGHFGSYWSSTQYSSASAWSLSFDGSDADTYNVSYRGFGRAVRCVTE
jgi:uncharacterized protein (TIGR02145 family)